MTLQDKCDKARDYLATKKKELEGLIREYGECSQDGRSPFDLLDVRDKLVAYSFELTTIMLRTKELHLEAQRDRESAHTTRFLEERGEINEKTGKPKSIDSAKMMATLSCAQEFLTESSAEINYYSAKFYKDDCQRVIDSLAQRVSTMKGEQFNSRNTSAA